MTVYRKWGRTIRWENGTIVRVDEAGQAIEESGEFHARPLGERRVLDEVARLVATAHGDAAHDADARRDLHG